MRTQTRQILYGLDPNTHCGLKLPSLAANRSQNGQKFFWFFFFKKRTASYHVPSLHHPRFSKSIRGSTTVYITSPTICISSPSSVNTYKVPNITG